MFRVLTILAAIGALAVSAAPASAGPRKPPPPSPKSHTATHPWNLNDIEAIDIAVTDGTSNTTLYADRSASVNIDIGTSVTARNGNGIIAVLIGL